jgi:hypothetical protein
MIPNGLYADPWIAESASMGAEVSALSGTSCEFVILEGGSSVVGINDAGNLEAGGWIFARDGLGPDGPVYPWPVAKGIPDTSGAPEDSP